jgi:hypothetical protein
MQALLQPNILLLTTQSICPRMERSVKLLLLLQVGAVCRGIA